MAVRRMVAVITICVMLAVAATPRRAQASNDTVWIVVGSIVGWIAIVGIGVWVTTDRTKPPDDSLMPGYRLPVDERLETTVHFGGDCQRKDESLPLVCW